MTRGGRRSGAGRPPTAEATKSYIAEVPLSPAEHAEILGAAGAVPLAEYLRTAGLERARRRR